MRKIRLTAAARTAIAVGALFLLALTLACISLLWNGRQNALAESEADARRFLSGAETALNRTLLGVDVMLASTDGLLGLSGLVAEWIDVKTANRLLRHATDANLLVHQVALVDAQGKVIASSDVSGAKLALTLPDGFVQDVLAQGVSTLKLSAPVLSFASSERVLYLARSIKLADTSRILAVAQVDLASLISIMIQGVDIAGLEVTLERSDGQLLAGIPAQERLLGQRLTPPLGQHSAAVRHMNARVTGAPALVATRPTLYGVLVVASIPLATALNDWGEHRNLVLVAAFLFALLILATCGFAVWYLERRAEVRLAFAQSKATLDQALESMVSGFVLLNAEHQVLNWNHRFVEFYPWVAELIAPLMPFRRILEAAARHLLPGGDEAQHEQWVKNRLALQFNAEGTNEQHLPNGQVIQVTERRTPEGGLVIVYHDVTELRRATAEVAQLAFYDPLTKLPNRRLLMDRLQHAISASERSGRYGALLFLDLDRFKTLNDTLGHSLGDVLLQQVAQRLSHCVRQEDTVARLGGDEFVVMLEDITEHGTEAAALALTVGEKILARLNQNYDLVTHSYHMTSSIGAALFKGGEQSAADLLRQADIAMYQVKSRGRNALCFFDPKMQAAINMRAKLEEDLHVALTAGEFVLYYQPQFMHQRGVIGAEVLIRWQHPQRGLVPPLEFISVAEDSELILPIGHWVLRTACRQLAAWQGDARRRELHLSVNVSARQFRQRDFVSQVSAVLEQTGAAPHLLKLELTESLVLDNIDECITKMKQLGALGVRFSVDDFGTGQSSLAYLARLPLNQLKIDQSFIRNINMQSNDDAIVKTIIGMASTLGMEVIAEGVETPAQQEFLAQHGCHIYQGYLFGKPTPLAEFEALLE